MRTYRIPSIAEWQMRLLIIALTFFFFTPYSFSKPVVWVYTSLYKEVIENMNPLLEKALPHIEVKWFQGGSETIASKVTAEIAAGGSQAHLILTSDPFWYYELKKSGKLIAYAGPSYNQPVTPEFSDPENFYRAIRLPVFVLGYHSEKIPENELPKKYADLLLPQWKNKIAMPSPLESGSSFTAVALLSRKFGWEFFEGLSRNQILAAGGNSSVLNRIETGERPLGFLLLENILNAQKKGSPIRPLYLEEGVIPISSPIALLKNQKFQKEAKEVYDWFYSQEAQVPITESGMFSLIPNAPTPKFSKSYAELSKNLFEWNSEILDSLFQNRNEIKNKFTEVVFHSSPPGTDGRSASKKVTAKNMIYEATVRSLLLSFFVALFSGGIGFILAWLVTRTVLPGSGLLAQFLSVPYILPAYLLGMAWIVLANPTVGLLRNFIPGSQGSYGFWAIVLVETSVAFTFPFLELKSGFQRMNASLEEAARMSGASLLHILKDISLPLLWPSLFNGMCLSFLYTLSSFGVPALLGLPVREYVLTTLIYSQLKLGGHEGLMTGLGLSLILLGIVVVVLLFSYFLNKIQNRKILTLVGGKSTHPSKSHLGLWKWPVALMAWGFLTVAIILPWCGLGLSALAPVAGNYAPQYWTFKNILTVLNLSDFQEALKNSLLLSLSVSSLTVILGFLLAYFAERRKNKLAYFAIELLGVPFATPGIVLAIVLIFISTWMNRVFSFQSLLFWLALGYALKYAALGAKMQFTAFRQVDVVLEEAARMSGASFYSLLKDIWAPLLKKTMGAVFLLSFLPMLTELAISTLLTGPGATTLGTVLFQLQEYADQSSAAALAWLLLTLALGIAFISSQSIRKNEGEAP